MTDAIPYLAAGHRWLADDPDPQTRAALAALLHAAEVGASAERPRAQQQLADCFARPLRFGTAGLRGLLGPGPARMNLRVVLETTAGFAAHLDSAMADARARGVCIGYDARDHSRAFAEAAASVLLGAGFRVALCETLVATPILAFSVKELHAAGGIMITASHNPAGYNGYKVFGPDGAQIIPPDDEAIQRARDAVPSVRALQRIPFDPFDPDHLSLGTPLFERYFAAVGELLAQVTPTELSPVPRSLRIAYTALHGVGEQFARRALADAGFSNVSSVASQATPDGTFPTLQFPNPEEPGAMDAVIALAKDHHADLAIANDPDGDRLAVAVQDQDGRWRTLSGNDVGCLLADFVLEQLAQRPAANRKNLVINTIVSSPLLAAIASAHGADYDATLTGFKWIAHRAMARMETHYHAFGYEEALGYSLGERVRDKDGISSAVLTATIAARASARGENLFDALVALWRRHGLYQSRQVSIHREGARGAEAMQTILADLRQNSLAPWGPYRVVQAIDYGSGTRTTARRDSEDRGTASTTLVEPLDAQDPLPRDNVLAWHLVDGHRVMARPSGTEPKIKFYLDTHTAVAADEPIVRALARAETVLDSLAQAITNRIGRPRNGSR